MAELLKIGEKAPDFESVDQDGRPVKLTDFTGKPVIVYFYPADDTPGCTAEACSFRDNINAYEQAGVKVLGVSVNTQNSHRKFADKYNLNFTLVVDNSKKIASDYGVLGTRSASRVTYIVGPDGKIAYVYPKVSPKDHAPEVMQKLRELKLVN